MPQFVSTIDRLVADFEAEREKKQARKQRITETLVSQLRETEQRLQPAAKPRIELAQQPQQAEWVPEREYGKLPFETVRRFREATALPEYPERYEPYGEFPAAWRQLLEGAMAPVAALGAPSFVTREEAESKLPSWAEPWLAPAIERVTSPGLLAFGPEATAAFSAGAGVGGLAEWLATGEEEPTVGPLIGELLGIPAVAVGGRAARALPTIGRRGVRAVEEAVPRYVAKQTPVGYAREALGPAGRETAAIGEEIPIRTGTLRQQIEDISELIVMNEESIASKAVKGKAATDAKFHNARLAAEREVLQDVEKARAAGKTEEAILADLQYDLDNMPDRIRTLAMRGPRRARPSIETEYDLAKYDAMYQLTQRGLPEREALTARFGEGLAAGPAAEPPALGLRAPEAPTMFETPALARPTARAGLSEVGMTNARTLSERLAEKGRLSKKDQASLESLIGSASAEQKAELQALARGETPAPAVSAGALPTEPAAPEPVRPGPSELAARTMPAERAKLPAPEETGAWLDEPLARMGKPPDEPPPGLRSNVLAEPPESAGHRFAAPLRDFAEVEAEVVTSESPVVRTLVGRTGINPSVLRDTPAGRALTAYWRQRVAAEELADVAVAGALDVHAERFTARRPLFQIDDLGRIKNLSAEEGQSRVWQDVFSRSGDYAKLSEAQRAYIDDFRTVIDEMETLRVEAGLRPRSKTSPEGWGYVPRQVKTLKGVELRRPPSPGLQRVYEEAQEGVAKGVRYQTDPRATLELHVRNAYREIAERQLSDFVEPLSVTPKELIPRPVLQTMSDAVQRRLAAERNLRRLRVERLRLQVGGKYAGPENRALRQAQETLRAERRGGRQALRAQIRTAQKELDSAMTEYAAARSRYTKALEAARKREVAPGALFGPNQPDNIAIAQWHNRFFPREDADRLIAGVRSFFTEPRGVTNIARHFQVLGNLVRFLGSVGDFAMPFIQGLPLLARNPVAWGRMTARHYQAFFDPTVQARFIRDHIGTFHKMAQHGVPIGDPEFFAALREGGLFPAGRLLEPLPKGAEARAVARTVGRQSFGRFQASYNVGLGSARAQLWEALEPGWKDSLDELAAYVRNMTGGLDSRALGVGPTQRGVESTWGAFSPRLLRSTVALVSDLRLGLRSARGREAFRTLSSLASGVTGIYVLSGLALGKSWDEIKTGLNPLSGKRFLSHEINGDWIGVGGQIRAITQLMAAVAVDIPLAATEGRKPTLFEASLYDNPLLSFYATRGAPGTRIMAATGEAATRGRLDVLPFDHVDNPIDLFKHIGMSALPFTLQGWMEGEQGLTTPFALAGFRTSPQTPYEAWEAAAQERYGAPFRELEPYQQREIREAEAGATEKLEQRTEEMAQAGDTGAQYRLRADREYNDVNERLKATLETLKPSPEAREAIKNSKIERAHVRHSLSLEYPEVVGRERQLKEDDPEWRRAFAAYDKVFDDPRLTGLPGGQTNPEYNDVLFDLLEDFERKYPRWTAIIDRNTNLDAKAIPLYASYERDMKIIEESGYWESDDVALRYMQRTTPWLKEYSNYRGFRAALESAADAAGLRPEDSPVWKEFEQVRQKGRTYFREQNPEVDVLLVIWFGLTPRTQAAAERAYEIGGRWVEPAQQQRARQLQPVGVR